MSAALTQLNTFTAHLKNVVFLVGLIIAVFSAMLSATTYGVVKFVWPMLLDELRVELNVATKEDVAELREKLVEVAGEDRIFQMPAGHSYVLEPVSKGEEITLFLVLRRTEYGAACVFIEATPLFRDSRDIPFPGATLPPVKQVGREDERLPLSMDAPSALQTGRVSVVLSMHYECPFGADQQMITAYEETDPIVFQLDPAAK